MLKDPLLSEEFFLLNEPSASEISVVQHDLEAFDSLIKEKLYPHLPNEQTPMYYQGEYTLSDLNQFVYQPGSSLHTDEFKTLQKELKLTIGKIRTWVDANGIEGIETLSSFLKKLEQPTDKMSVLYSDGKKLLEKIAVLLDDPSINLASRQAVVINLLANKELEKCIAGCYSRIASAVWQLQENLDGNQQIKYWLRSYAKDMASQLAAKPLFAMPDTYQVLLCKATGSSGAKYVACTQLFIDAS